MKSIIKIYTDGSADNKNQEKGGGWAFYHRNKDNKVIYCSGFEPGIVTNNKMELSAVLGAINYFTQHYKYARVKLCSTFLSKI